MTLVVDRYAQERNELTTERLLEDETTRVLDLVGGRAFVVESEDPHAPRLVLRPPAPRDVSADIVVFLGRDDAGRAVLAVSRSEEGDSTEEMAADPRASGHDARPVRSGLREVGAWLPADEVSAFMTGVGMATWHATHGFCPRCGAATEPGSAGWVRHCPTEGRELYPRTDPAVIMAIRDADDRLLLGRSPQWPEGRRSVLAGFVEPGESLEDAVRREVAEEVGVVVGRVDYVGSQAWPFPASLMVGFAGWAEGTDLRLQESEMAEAEWYSRRRLIEAVNTEGLALPGRMSISRHLIEHWYGGLLTVPGVDDRVMPSNLPGRS